MSIVCDPSYRVIKSIPSCPTQEKQTHTIRAIYDRNEKSLASLISSKKVIPPFHADTFWN